ncbi:MAG: hypothetical protein ACLPLR_13080 [Terriglobales bacterium]
MPPGVDEVRHDAASLQRFVDSIASSCQRDEEYPCYEDASKKFFKYIHSLGEATKNYLAQFVSLLDPNLASSDPQDFYSQTQVIRTLRLGWFELHQLVKPALDADTLHVPYPLVRALTSRFRLITGFNQAEFAVLHSTELNYFQMRASYMRERAAEIAAIVPSAPPFPPELGIVAIPYSQSSSLFLNVALAHEMGHFAFQEHDEASKLAPAVLRAIQTAAGRVLLPIELAWCKDRVLRWCEEVYCDLFALSLIGPAFSFSFIELFAYSRLAPNLAPGGTTTVPIASESTFRDSHPAAAYRLGEHVRFLQRDDVGWWKKIETSSSHYVRLLLDSAALPVTTTTYKFVTQYQYKPGLEKIALDAFFATANDLSATVKATFAGVPSEADVFENQCPLIEEYLSYGVVPSRLVPEDGAYSPSIVSLVNSAYLFYVDHLDTLINKIAGARAECLECRSLWAERVEMWTSKALEDVTK